MLDFFFFSSRRRHTRYWRDWSSDVCSSDLSSFELYDDLLLGCRVRSSRGKGTPPCRRRIATWPPSRLEVATQNKYLLPSRTMPCRTSGGATRKGKALAPFDRSNYLTL